MGWQCQITKQALENKHMKKGQIIYVRFAGEMRRFIVIATDGKDWVAKDWLGITVSSLDGREMIVTDAVKKWWQVWK